MNSFSEQLNQYSQQHTHRLNKLFHFIGMPMIIFSVLMAFNWLNISIAPNVHVRLSWIVIAATLIYYYFLNIRLAFVAAIVFVLANVFCISVVAANSFEMNAIVFLILFFVGWILLFAGHAFEKSRPAFLYSVNQLLVGPLFLLVEILQSIGLGRLVK
ncbi:MAG: Mpo1-like protein [Gammaproteobacteria bacterium]|nr:Mpo1-like protein [Gammaproteobacteria bacterium]